MRSSREAGAGVDYAGGVGALIAQRLGFVPAEQIDIARLLGSGLPGQELHQRRIVLDEFLQNQLHFVEIFQAMHALAASAQLARSLRPAQQQGAEQSVLAPAKVQNLAHAVFKARHPSLGPRHYRPGPFASSECNASRTASSSSSITGSRFDF